MDMFEADDNFNFSKTSFTLMKPMYRRQFFVDHKVKYDESMRVGEDFTLYVGKSIQWSEIHPDR